MSRHPEIWIALSMWVGGVVIGLIIFGATYEDREVARRKAGWLIVWPFIVMFVAVEILAWGFMGIGRWIRFMVK